MITFDEILPRLVDIFQRHQRQNSIEMIKAIKPILVNRDLN